MCPNELGILRQRGFVFLDRLVGFSAPEVRFCEARIGGHCSIVQFDRLFERQFGLVILFLGDSQLP